MTRKIFVITMIITMILGTLAGCTPEISSQGVTTSSSSATKATTTTATSTMGTTETGETIQIELFYSPWASTPFDGVDPYEKFLEEKYKCDFFLTPATEFQTQILSRAAADDMPDLILTGLTDLMTLYEQGVVLDDWSPYLADMPQTTANISDLARTFLSIDDKMIACPGRAGEQAFCFNVRMDWMNELGLDQPTTTDELLEMLRAFTFNDPDKNGKDDTFGFTAAGGNMGVGELRNLQLLFSSPGFYIDETGNVNHYVLDGSFKDYLTLAKTIVSENLIDPDWYTQGWDERKPDLYSGLFGMCWYPARALLVETNEARNYDGSVLEMWDTMKMFSGKLNGEPIHGALRTVSAAAAADEPKMKIICDYLENCAYPNEDYFIVRDGYKIDGKDIFSEIGDGVYFIGKSSSDLVTLRVSGSIMFGWGQMVQAQGAPYYSTVNPEPSEIEFRSAELAETWNSIEKYAGDYRLLNPDPTLVEESNRIIAEFELDYILGKKDAAQYDEFVALWKSAAGDELLADAIETFQKYGLMG